MARKKTSKKTKGAQSKPSTGSTAAASPHENRPVVVGIGASAGGLEALEGFFSPMPTHSGMAFVVVQHLASGHQSIMDTLLKKHTHMQVMQIEDGQHLATDCVYLNQPDKDVAILNDTFCLLDPKEKHAVRLPIDYFFRSLAQDRAEEAIGIILSGTGTDGTQGLKAIKDAGGMAMAQIESQAKFDNMPRSAIDTGLVDMVLPVEQMADKLLNYIKHPYVNSMTDLPAPKEMSPELLKKVFVLIRSKTGHDFSNYKQNTIRRRLERRMAVHQIDRLSDYVHLLQEKSNEVDALYKDMLITVTHFFRDPEAFSILENEVFPELLKRHTDTGPVRMWVAGCGTGEEAYSLAILAVETMTRLNLHLDIQIFATDLDDAAVEFARYGVFPEAITADVSKERLRHFFTHKGDCYQIKRQIREMVVFAQQNLIKDPPFSKLDLVSCRNVLIYMDRVLQKKILPLFYYTLNPQGILFLGSSETVGEFVDCFEPVDTKWKLFRRKTSAMARATLQPILPFYEPDSGPLATRNKISVSQTSIRQVAEQAILRNYAPPCVLVNNRYEILYFYGETDQYLSLPMGEPSFNILKMTREELRYKLNHLLHQAFEDKKTVSACDLHLRHNQTSLTIDLIAKPLLDAEDSEPLVMVIFECHASPPEAGKPAPDPVPQPHGDPHVSALEQELASTKEYLQTMIEELETSNEELKSTNEELQSTNEELQSTNEELETSREELQSTNEELETVNAELQDKVGQLSHANNDLNNLLASTQIGTIFLDLDLCIRRFTPSAKIAFNFRQTDLGRPLSDIASKLTYEDLMEDARGVLESLREKQMEMKTRDGTWLSVRLLPYRTVDNVIDGVVIVFINIDRIKEAEHLRHWAMVIQNSEDAVTIQDLDGRITAWNRGAERLYGYSETEALELTVERIIPDGQKEQVSDWAEQLRSGQAHNPFICDRLTQEGQAIKVELSLTPLLDQHGNLVAIASTAREISVDQNTA